MIKHLNLILFFLLPIHLYGQAKCDCPENHKDENLLRIFSFKNGHIIGLCGSKEKGEEGSTYNNSVLYDCKTRKMIAEFDGYNPYYINFKNDTLEVSELNWLPVGKNFVYRSIAIDTTKFYPKNKELITAHQLNKQLPRYSTVQVGEVLRKYNDILELKKKNYYDSIIVISDMLFWSYVSGSKQAEKYLTQVEKIAGPFDGAISEEWNEIWMLYLNYKEKSGQAKIK